MAETTRTLHMSVAIDWLRQFLQMREREGRPQDIVTRDDGQPVGYAAALEYLATLEADGFEFVPACDAADERGKCGGHR